MRDELLQTASGRAVPLFAFTPAHVHAPDIAHALAHLCRFNGHTRAFYSVAEHSIRVAHTLWLAHDEDPRLALYGLLHDASEAYLGDVVTPLKRRLGEAYAALERDVQNAIYQAFGLDPVTPGAVHHADQVLLVTEARDLLTGAWPEVWPRYRHVRPLGARIVPYTQDLARDGWLEALRFYRREADQDDRALRGRVS